ncbi:hypothetical protein [Amycolatopsis taiwanensis]|uniref:hypothetical protein n=1 Tax=Amycolatopsis taiwanensis TaxID=342230 RepID=UPI000484BFDC|nr:hypothetical protein [Amycolatopsis taiwanensis]
MHRRKKLAEISRSGPQWTTRSLLAGVVAAGVTAVPAPAEAEPVGAPATAVSATVTLPTGDRVVVPASGQPSYLGSSPGGVVSYQGANGDRYVIPAIAQPYLGKQLDPSLFDVSALARDDAATRIPVTLTFAAGATPATPAGVTLTSVDGTSARGYLTPGRDFADLLRSRIGADVAAGRKPGTSGLFDGLAAMNLATGAPGPIVQPRYPMRTLQINGVDEAGAPGNFTVFVMNTDSMSKMAIQVPLVDGIARIAVPTGNYTASAGVGSYDEQGNNTAMRFVDLNDFAVDDTSAPSSITIDMRAANSAISVRTPRPATQDIVIAGYYRFDATGRDGMNIWVGATGQVPVYVNAQPAARTGRLHYLLTWGGTAADPGERYRYNVVFPSDNGVSADQAYTVRTDQLATVRQRLSADPGYAGKSISLLTVPTDPAISSRWGGGVGAADSGATVPGELTQYLGTADGGQWANMYNAPFMPLIGDVRTYAAGKEYAERWGHGPIAAGFGQYTGTNTCLACVAGSTVGLAIPSFHDSAGHTSADQAPMPGHLALYRDGTRLVDEDTYGVVITDNPARKSTYRAVFDVDLTGQGSYRQATKTTTDLTFSYSPNPAPGSTLPASGTCPGQTASTPCRILPVLTLNYQMASDDTNTSGLAVQTMGVKAGHLSYDGAGSKAPITSLTVSVSFDGGATWQPSTVYGSTGDYTARWSNPASARGTSPALRVTATDAIGGSITQTITDAYTIAG